ncbi:metallopeptidase [Candidatus Beckwithbacteria bacterium CG10_big_fil_rev_8_21_14_0_10_34_10]|uniref:Metallopeptidase n=1 Tax=Candidatus Beckwithbacteria bacterium CG10_big_fil_rev_8_21_14_0_10_34_10 TaxID=1974495 RepID=A0A2H0WAD1_9BACT|nr:MAG: metallopeptidase [Candidatus Beckwithbacteria bacterium CG10_big_fil_rev_8_21_14_0_10_34_10]
MEFNFAPDIKKRIKEVLNSLDLGHIKGKMIVCFRSTGSTSRAMARIWSLPTIWQKALKTQPHYCIEVLSEKFDRLSKVEQTKVLIHELMHIPKTFSGALLPHRGRGKVKIDRRSVNKLYRLYLKERKKQ